jgi:hypothetical protein
VLGERRGISSRARRSAGTQRGHIRLGKKMDAAGGRGIIAQSRRRPWREQKASLAKRGDVLYRRRRHPQTEPALAAEVGMALEDMYLPGSWCAAGAGAGGGKPG